MTEIGVGAFRGAIVWVGLFLLASTSAAPTVRAQSGMEDVVIGTTRLTDHIHMLTGRGGNLAVFAGDDGVFLVDDQYAPLTDRIREAIDAISTGPVRFVLNTHWHGDHTGGNENFGAAGSLILAHDNVRVRMASEQISTIWGRTTPPSADGALPVITFDAAITFHLDGEEIHAFHVERAHTDGDAIVHFRTANVLHMGDVFFNGLYPFIDTDSGGSIDGMIAAVERALGLCDDGTQIVPGHGPLAGIAELKTYHAMLTGVRDAIAPLVAQGSTLEQVQALHPTAPWDEVWGKAWIDGAKFTEIVYGDLARD